MLRILILCSHPFVPFYSLASMGIFSEFENWLIVKRQNRKKWQSFAMIFKHLYLPYLANSFLRKNFSFNVLLNPKANLTLYLSISISFNIIFVLLAQTYIDMMINQFCILKFNGTIIFMFNCSKQLCILNEKNGEKQFLLIFINCCFLHLKVDPSLNFFRLGWGGVNLLKLSFDLN